MVPGVLPDPVHRPGLPDPRDAAVTGSQTGGPTPMQIVGARIRDLRLLHCAAGGDGQPHAGWTQAQVSVLVGVHQVTVSEWERGHKVPSHANRVRLAAVLRVDPGVLFAEVSAAERAAAAHAAA